MSETTAQETEAARTPAELLARASEAFERFETDPEGAVDALDALYAPHVMFRDPLQVVHGREAVTAMNRRFAARFPRIRVELGHGTVSPEAAHLSWTAELSPRIGPAIRIDAVTTFVVEDGRIAEHRDHWDLLGAFMDAVPLAGSVYRMLAAKLG